MQVMCMSRLSFICKKLQKNNRVSGYILFLFFFYRFPSLRRCGIILTERSNITKKYSTSAILKKQPTLCARNRKHLRR